MGKAWEPGAFEELLGDVTSQLFGAYGDDTVVYPGHGDDTTIGAERPHLDEWRSGAGDSARQRASQHGGVR